MTRGCERNRKGASARALLLVAALALQQVALAQSEGEVSEGAGTGRAEARRQPEGARTANYRLEIEAPAELVEALRTQTLLGRWRTDPDFEPAQLPLFVEQALEEAQSIAQAAGFFSAKVRVAQTEAAAGADVPRVRIEVDAGARTTVNRFEFELQGEAAAAGLDPLLRGEWPLPEGSFFLSERWEFGKRQMLEQMQQRGFLRARIAQSLAEVDPVATTAGLRVVLDSGPRLRFGETRIRGLSRYPSSIVEAQVPWDQGDPYSFDAMMKLQDRLQSDGHFTSATVLPNVAAVEADETREDVPINVEVRERRRQRFTFGLGFSTDKGARGLAGYDHFDVLGRGWIADTGLLAESVEYRAFANLRTPFDGHGHYFRGGARVERLDVSGELTQTKTVFVGRGKRSDYIESLVSLQYQDERSEIGSDTGPITGTSAALTLGYSWATQRVDSKIDPRSGYTLNTQVSGASERLASDRSFVRLWGRAMVFWPVPSDSRLAGGLLVGRVEAGQVFAGARDGIPSGNLFRTGGAQTIRGYSYLDLGVPEGNAIVGGRVLALASVEYQHPVVPDWMGAVFVDVGNAADRWAEYRAVAGAGVGVRWRSPIGPLNLDVAYGEATNRWHVHFSVGYTF